MATNVARTLKHLLCFDSGRFVSGMLLLFQFLMLPAVSYSQDANPGGLAGSVTLLTTDGTRLVPESATISLIFCDGSPPRSNTACGVYLAEQLKVAKSIVKETSRNKDKIAQEPMTQRVDEFAKYYLESVDAGLKATADWAKKHSNHRELITIEAVDGAWSQNGLQPGRYKIVARGVVGDLDAEWETYGIVEPNATISIPLTQIKFGRKIKP